MPLGCIHSSLCQLLSSRIKWIVWVCPSQTEFFLLSEDSAPSCGFNVFTLACGKQQITATDCRLKTHLSESLSVCLSWAVCSDSTCLCGARHPSTSDLNNHCIHPMECFHCGRWCTDADELQKWYLSSTCCWAPWYLGNIFIISVALIQYCKSSVN